MQLRFVLASLLFLSSLAPARLSAELKLPSVFGNHMVLQRDQALPVWGWDAPGTEVSVSLGEARAAAKADAEGKWSVKLPAMKAGGPHVLEVKGTSTARFEDVAVGEVWICSGQSNMEWTVAASADAEKEIAAASEPRIRHIKVPHTPAAAPQADVAAGGWQLSSPATTGSFTAVGYYFARRLLKDLDVTVGLIGSNWGGTRIEPWIPPQGFQKVEALKDIAEKLAEFPQKSPEGKVNHQSALALYNGMIHPLVPYAVRGALWYQGESNNGEGMLYHEKMKALIAGWRALWDRDDMPFYYVQLAPYRYGGDPTKLAGIWEAQLATLAVPHTGMAVTVDISNVADIHPRNKQDVGKRLALCALAKTYGKHDVVHSGPLYKSMDVQGDAVRLAFEHLGGGLVSRDGKPLSWFTIAGEDRKFVPAEASIDGDKVVVRAAAVPHPVAVRFGWHQEAEPNLSNKEGLPASPFRTDKW
jgi:sialate O-acetylesterase